MQSIAETALSDGGLWCTHMRLGPGGGHSLKPAGIDGQSTVEHTHEFLVNGLLVLIFPHVAGVVLSQPAVVTAKIWLWRW